MDITAQKARRIIIDWKSAAFAILVILFTLSVYIFIPVQSHWLTIFRPAALEFLVGRSPYQIPLFMNPPWALLPILPLAMLPARVGNALMATFTACVFIYVAHKMGAKILAIILLFLNPYMLYTLYNVNLNWLVALGYVLPPQLGLFFVLIKPQIGIGMAIFWFFEAMREGGIKRTIVIFAPMTLAVILSLVIFGPWMINGLVGPSDSIWSFWPRSLLPGFVLLYLAIKKRSKGLAIIASPLFSPYVGHVSIINPLFGLLPDRHLIVIAIITLWLVWLLSGDFRLIAF